MDGDDEGKEMGERERVGGERLLESETGRRGVQTTWAFRLLLGMWDHSARSLSLQSSLADGIAGPAVQTAHDVAWLPPINRPLLSHGVRLVDSSSSGAFWLD